MLDLRVPVEAVPLGTTPAHFQPGVDTSAVRAKYGLNGGPWLLTVARLEWHKGIDTTMTALAAVRAAHPGTRYAIVGTGERLAQFEQLRDELRLGDAVRFLGGISDAELPAIYNAADLYVGASRRFERGGVAALRRSRGRIRHLARRGIGVRTGGRRRALGRCAGRRARRGDGNSRGSRRSTGGGGGDQSTIGRPGTETTPWCGGKKSGGELLQLG